MSDFAFVQFEFPWALGAGDGRYVLRGHAGVPAHVLVLNTLGALERRGLTAASPRRRTRRRSRRPRWSRPPRDARPR